MSEEKHEHYWEWPQKCYNGVRLLDGKGPSLRNVEKLDDGALPMVILMAQTGLEVDLSHFARLEKTLNDDMDALTEDVHSLTGRYINIDSGDQVADLLFKKLKLKQARPKLTPSGDRESVADEILTAIQHNHPIVPKIQDYKELSKLRGTYVVPMPKLARRTAFGTWRMYPNFKHTRVPSGRLACSDPNLLAMPNRTKRGREIRKGFIAGRGKKIVSVDESQIEVRLAAHSSKDANLMAVYENGEDVYSDYAISAFKLKDDRYRNDKGKWIYPSVDPQAHRFPSKTCVLACIYEVSPPGLLEQMPVVCDTCGKPTECLLCAQDRPHTECFKHDCRRFRPLWTEDKCGEKISAFYIRYPGVLIDRKRHHGMCRTKGFAWDMWGRILHSQAVRSVHPWVVSAGLREIGNFPYQSGAQGTIKLTMAQVYDEFLDWRLWDPNLCAPLLQVHDELLFEVREDLVEDVINYVRYRFENCCRLRVPIKTSGASADSWGSVEK